MNKEVIGTVEEMGGAPAEGEQIRDAEAYEGGEVPPPCARALGGLLTESGDLLVIGSGILGKGVIG